MQQKKKERAHAPLRFFVQKKNFFFSFCFFFSFDFSHNFSSLQIKDLL